METKLDRIDRQILEALQNEARLSNKELAARVGLSPSSCLERVKKLKDDGVLQGFHADVRPEALGIGVQALIFVKLRQHSRDLVSAFWAHTRGLPEVLSLFHVTGEHDFIIQVAVRDMQHLRDLAMDAFTTRPEVGHLQTSLVFEWTKAGHLPNYVDGPTPAASPARVD